MHIRCKNYNHKSYKVHFIRGSLVKYLDLFNVIKNRIIDGTYKPWDSIPTEQKLIDEFKVSRPTVRQAISKLKHKGFINSRQGAYSYVNPPEFYRYALLNVLSEVNLNVSSKVIFFEIINPPKKIQSIFNCCENDLFFHYKRLRLVDNKPVELEETHMPYSVFPSFKESHLLGSVFNYIEIECGITLTCAYKTIMPYQVTEEEAKILDIETGTYTLKNKNVINISRDKVAQHTEIVGRATSITIGQVRDK